MQSGQSPSQSVIKRHGLNGYGAIEILHNYYYYYYYYYYKYYLKLASFCLSFDYN